MMVFLDKWLQLNHTASVKIGTPYFLLMELTTSALIMNRARLRTHIVYQQFKSMLVFNPIPLKYQKGKVFPDQNPKKKKENLSIIGEEEQHLTQ
jgi:hypothetical protein